MAASMEHEPMSNTLAPQTGAAQAARPADAMIALSDTAQITSFGEKAQREIAGFADQVLRQARGSDFGDTGALLTDLMAKAKGLDVESLKTAGPLSQMFGGVRRRLVRFKAQFETAADQIDAIGAELKTRVDRMRTELVTLDGLHAQGRMAIEELDGYIAAGKAFGESFRARELVELEAAAKNSSDLLAAQAYQDALLSLDRLEKRIFTLQQARQIALQQLPQIRMVQNGDAALVASLDASITLTIPAWKQKMVMLLGLERQKEALALQEAVTETTNELISRTSEMLHTQALEIEQQSQRGLVDLDVLARTNNELIETVNSLLRIQSAGRSMRADAEREMERQTRQLRDALAAPDLGQAAAPRLSAA